MRGPMVDGSYFKGPFGTGHRTKHWQSLSDEVWQRSFKVCNCIWDRPGTQQSFRMEVVLIARVTVVDIIVSPAVQGVLDLEFRSQIRRVLSGRSGQCAFGGFPGNVSRKAPRRCQRSSPQFCGVTSLEVPSPRKVDGDLGSITNLGKLQSERNLAVVPVFDLEINQTHKSRHRHGVRPTSIPERKSVAPCSTECYPECSASGKPLPLECSAARVVVSSALPLKTSILAAEW
eukprot:6098625-Amphidinium_carterae.1